MVSQDFPTTIANLSMVGTSQKKIGRIIKISRVTIILTLRRHHEIGMIQNRPRSGRTKIAMSSGKPSVEARREARESWQKG